jgi:hypothetical protein
MGAVDLLRQLSDDGRTRGVGQLVELAEMIADGPASAWSLERRADEECPLDRL